MYYYKLANGTPCAKCLCGEACKGDEEIRQHLLAIAQELDLKVEWR